MDNCPTIPETGIAWRSQDLPIPIDKFDVSKMEPLPDLCKIDAPRLPSNVHLWITVAPEITSELLSELLKSRLVSAMRINTAKFPELSALTAYIQMAAKIRQQHRPDVSICLDFSSAKIRVRALQSTLGSECVPVSKGDEFLLVAGDAATELPRDARIVRLSASIGRLQVGQFVFISDGWLQLQAIEVNDRYTRCRALHASEFHDGRGVDVLGLYDDMSPSFDDIERIVTGIGKSIQNVEYFALSFANKQLDVRLFQRTLQRLNAPGKIAAKIETLRGVDNAAEIADAADILMIARGDLFVQLALKGVDTVSVEDSLRLLCKRKAKRCVIATRVADSLQCEHAMELSSWELLRLNHELALDVSLELMLSYETAIGPAAPKNLFLIETAIRKLATAQSVATAPPRKSFRRHTSANKQRR